MKFQRMGSTVVEPRRVLKPGDLGSYPVRNISHECKLCLTDDDLLLHLSADGVTAEGLQCRQYSCWIRIQDDFDLASNPCADGCTGSEVPVNDQGSTWGTRIEARGKIKPASRRTGVQKIIARGQA